MLSAAAGDADYNDVVDAARIAGHKVHLYHSHSVAHTLQGNVDHHEAWHAFLARKSGQSVEDLEDTGFTPRGMSPVAFQSAGVHLALSLISHGFERLHAVSWSQLHLVVKSICLLLQMPCVWYNSSPTQEHSTKAANMSHVLVKPLLL